MWDIFFYNFVVYRGMIILLQVCGFFDEDFFFLQDSMDEGEDIVDMDNFYFFNVEVSLFNGQVLLLQLGK